jgi:hypothetical protein
MNLPASQAWGLRREFFAGIGGAKSGITARKNAGYKITLDSNWETIRPRFTRGREDCLVRSHPARTMGDGCCEEDKMEWVITLIVLMIVPFWIVLWWIPHCDAIGIQKAKVN